MNMPVNDDDQTVTFHTTLFALIRTALDIKIKGNMFDNDKELRRIIKTIWPNVSEKMLDKILPKPSSESIFYCVCFVHYETFILIYLEHIIGTCCMLTWFCRKHSNSIWPHDNTPVKSTFLSGNKKYSVT